jgi:hypothetical protein
VLGAHECAVARPEQKLRIDKRAEQRIARSAIQAPQPLCLRRRQAESGHFDVLPLNAPKHLVVRLML